MTANVITYKPRSAFREMSKILGFPESIANRFTDLCASPKVHDASRDPVSDEACKARRPRADASTVCAQPVNRHERQW